MSVIRLVFEFWEGFVNRNRQKVDVSLTNDVNYFKLGVAAARVERIISRIDVGSVIHTATAQRSIRNL